MICLQLFLPQSGASIASSALYESESEVAQSCPTLSIPWTAAHQAPLSMRFSREEYWSGLPTTPGTEPGSPALQSDSLPSEPLEMPLLFILFFKTLTLCEVRLFSVLFWQRRNKSPERWSYFLKVTQHIPEQNSDPLQQQTERDRNWRVTHPRRRGMHSQPSSKRSDGAGGGQESPGGWSWKNNTLDAMCVCVLVVQLCPTLCNPMERISFLCKWQCLKYVHELFDTRLPLNLAWD